MLTRCPGCTTRFRIYPEDLEAANGQVRCGRCDCVFDARIHAVTLESPLLATPERPPTGSLRDSNRISWRVGNVLLAALLVLQGIWWTRFQLVENDILRQIIMPLCQVLPCGFPLLRAPERIEVLDRTLEPDPQRTDLLHFRLRMVNRATHPQPFPLLELRLLDGQGKMVGQRRFTPLQYRPAPEPRFMSPGIPLSARLDLLDPSTHASGFQIDFR